jgi:hypothetical protein
MIYPHFKRNRKGEFKPEDCDKFVQWIIEDFEIKMGKSPTLLLVPENHTGEETYGKHIIVRREVVPMDTTILDFKPRTKKEVKEALNLLKFIEVQATLLDPGVVANYVQKAAEDNIINE